MSVLRVDDRGLTWEVSEASRLQWTICAQNLWLWSAQAEQAAVINRRPESLKSNYALLG